MTVWIVHQFYIWPRYRHNTALEKFEDIVRSRKLKKDRQYNGWKKKDKEKFEDIKGVVRSRKLKKDRQYNCQD
jgi:hypothetical protein